MTGIILSGGNNKRILTDKAFLKIGQKTIIEREIEVLSSIFSRIIIVTNSPEKYKHLKADLVSDLIPNKGPLGGIYSSFNISQDEHNFIVGCDLPFLNRDIISYMIESVDENNVIVPRIDGFLEPLHAIYSKDCLIPIKKHLDENDLKIQSFFDEVKVKYIEKNEIKKFDPDLITFFNVNTQEELKKAESIALKYT